MKKIILLFLMAIAMTTSAFSARSQISLRTHKYGENSGSLNERDRYPINLPIAVYYDSDTNILEVWCDDDNIQAEVYVYNESGAVEAYSPYMNVRVSLTISNTHSILLVADGWEAEGEI